MTVSGLTSTVLMVKPCAFGYNEETAATNSMQIRPKLDCKTVQSKAAQEFADYVKLLTSHGVEVIEVADTPEPPTPDSIFPNNWFSTHGEDSSIVLYPMCCANRRAERGKDVLATLRKLRSVSCIRDLSSLEEQQEFLEGTGSLVLDRINRVAFAAMSPRTTHSALSQWANYLGYQIASFNTSDGLGNPVYHTNVMMTIGDNFAIICDELIRSSEERHNVLSLLKELRKEVVSIDEKQMANFAGNAIQLCNAAGEKLLVMSATGWQSLSPAQQNTLESRHTHVLTPNIETIETIGGGSARCMVAEIFLSVR